jgi:hypothetical protein
MNTLSICVMDQTPLLIQKLQSSSSNLYIINFISLKRLELADRYALKLDGRFRL